MKLNKFLLVSIFLLAIISLGAVNAAETADDNLTAVDDGGDLEVESLVDENIDDGGDSAVGDEKLGEENNDQPLASQEVNLTVYPYYEEIEYGDTNIICIQTVESASSNSNINVTVNNNTYTSFFYLGNGQFWVQLNEVFNIAVYPVEVSFLDEQNGFYGSGTTSFEVVKAKINTNGKASVIYHYPEATNVKYGQSFNVTGSFYGSEGDPTSTGNVTIQFADVTYENIPLVNGSFNFEINKYSKVANSQSIKITYAGDDNYKPKEISTSINIAFDAQPYDARYGQIAFITVNMYEATGNVSFTLNGKTFNQTLVNGTATQEFTNYKFSRNDVEFKYLGDDNFNPITQNIRFYTGESVEAHDIYDGQPAIVKLYLFSATGNATFTLNDDVQTVPVVNGVATFESYNYTAGDYDSGFYNAVDITYNGDDTFGPFSTYANFFVYGKENATISSAVYKTATKNQVVVCIPYGTGNVTAVINGKEEILELIDGVAYYNIPEGQEINEINVTYEGNFRLNPANSTEFAYLTDNIVNNDNYMYYFSQRESGKLFNFIENGTTLDFQGKIINPNEKNLVWFDVSKPVNIISSTNDAYIDLNTTAGSLMGENPGNRFTVSRGGSWSNITGIYFHNTQLWVFNTTHVVLDRVSNVIEDQRVGSGVGATSIRANSTWVTVKNSYFYTRNNGGSSSLVIAWADYCTFDNNTIVVEGEVGNMIYLTTYNVDIPSGVLPNVYNNITNNKIYGFKKPAAICWALVISGANNYVADNYIEYEGGVGINQQWGQGDFINNTYTRNVLVGANGLFLPTSTVYNNTIGGTATTGANTVFFNNTVGKALTVSEGAEAYDNKVGGLTLSGARAVVHDNVINGATTISKDGIQIYDNTFLGDNTIKFNSGAKNNNFVNNSVVGNIEFGNKNAAKNNITDNTIVTSKNYAVDLKTYTGTGNNISDNILVSKKGTGNSAVNHKADETLTIDNYQNETAEIYITAEPIKVGQDAVFNVTANVTSIAQAEVVVNGKEYTVDLVDGKGSVKVSGLLANNYNVIVTSLDKTYAAQNSTTLSVTKNDCPEIVVDAPDKTQWINSTITVTINDATGKVTLSINGTDIPADLIDGVAVFDVPDLEVGEYNFTIAYEGDYKYIANSTEGTLKVNKNKEVIIIVSDLSVDKLASEFQATLLDYIGNAIAGAELTLNANNQDVTAFTDANGTATFDISLTMGSYPVTVSFSGIPDEYDANSANATINVIDSTSISIVSISGDDFTITAVLKDVKGKPIANADVSYTINNGEKVNATTNDKGEFVAYVKDNSLITLIFEGNDFAVASNASITLKNIKPVQKATKIDVPTTMTKTAVDFNAGEKGSMFYFYLLDEDGKAVANKGVKIGIFDKIYTVKTDKNGRGGLQINIANANYYTYAISFLGDDDYKASFAVCSLQIVKKSVTITPAKTSYSFKASAKTKTVTATLKSTNSYIPKGKQVTLTIAGKTFKATIGAKGQISFNIGSITKKGTYKVAIKFAGTNTYAAANSKTITIKIA